MRDEICGGGWVDIERHDLRNWNFIERNEFVIRTEIEGLKFVYTSVQRVCYAVAHLPHSFNNTNRRAFIS